jgi:cation:H+ antiporter
MTALMIIGGLVLLVIGGEMLVRGSVRVAERLGVSPLLIGLTLVGFGTSTPELVTSVQAAMIGSPGIAVGNIVGSNIANILLILGISALIFPLAVQSNALRRDGAVVIASALLMAAAAMTFGLSRPVGIGFAGLLVAYLVYAYRQERVATVGINHTAAFERAEAMEEADPALRPRTPETGGVMAWTIPILTAVAGLAVIIVGGRILVDGAVDLARAIGMSETVIGLTIVAVGTSMPELVTSVMAAMRKHADVAVGNVLGSNIYNILGIGGLTGVISPTVVPPEMLRLDLPVLVGVSILLFIFARSGGRISRIEGGAFLALYLAYVSWLVLQGGAGG